MNQNIKQLARDKFDEQLLLSRWIMQNNKSVILHAGISVNVRELQTNVSTDDYFLFTDHIQVNSFQAKHMKVCVSHTIYNYRSKQREGKLKYPNDDVYYALYYAKRA